jgi:hypothetical protein
LRELALSAVNNCTAINKEKINLSLILFLLLDYGYVGKTVLVLSTHTQIVVAAVNSTGTTLALYIIVAVFRFDFITTDIAANGIFDNQCEPSFVKSSCIRCAP